jgi:uncharacterized coiled-coil protein SlyX
MSEGMHERLEALESRVELEAGLRASVDRDLATIAQRQSAANHLIQALAITQAEHTQTLAEHTQTLAELMQGLAELAQGLAGLTQRLTEHTTHLQHIIALLEDSTSE